MYVFRIAINQQNTRARLTKSNQTAFLEIRDLISFARSQLKKTARVYIPQKPFCN